MLRGQLDRMTQTALAGKDNQLNQAAQDRDSRLQLQRLELDNAKHQEKIFRMQDQMQQVYQTLGKVTGSGDPLSSNNGLLTAFNSKDSTANYLEHAGSSQKTSQASSSGFDEQLAMRAEEIVLIVE